MRKLNAHLVLALLVVTSACGEPPERLELEYEQLDPERPAALLGMELSWLTPITEPTLGELPDGLVEGATLRDIVSSRHLARPDGFLCSECHYRDSEDPYRPDIEQGSDEEIDPFEVIDGRAWRGDIGWAARFMALDDDAHYTKPAYLRAVFSAWRADGEMKRTGLRWQSQILEETMGMVPVAEVADKRMSDIINSQVSGRPDAKLCSECHFAGAAIPYRPDVEKNESGGLIGPHDVVDGRSWSGPGGWADRFMALHEEADFTKPLYLRELFECWKEDGEQ